MQDKLIIEVLDLMDSYARKYEHEGLHAFNPFLHVYKRVTETVYERLDEFEEPEKLVQLDVEFAKLYFDAIEGFFRTGEKIPPWSTYISYCSSSRPIPFLTVLLGINAHINSDLLTATYTCNYTNEHDFMLVNDILGDLTPEIMRYLALKEHDIFGMAGMVFKHFTIYEFRKTIQQWRINCWRNKTDLRPSLFLSQKNHYHNQTEEIAEELIQLFTDITHGRHALGFLHHLNNTQLSLQA